MVSRRWLEVNRPQYGKADPDEEVGRLTNRSLHRAPESPEFAYRPATRRRAVARRRASERNDPEYRSSTQIVNPSNRPGRRKMTEARKTMTMTPIITRLTRSTGRT